MFHRESVRIVRMCQTDHKIIQTYHYVHISSVLVYSTNTGLNPSTLYLYFGPRPGFYFDLCIGFFCTVSYV